MAKTEFYTAGLSQAVSDLTELERTFLKKMGAGMFTEAVIIEQESRRRKPVLTGALRGSHETTEPDQLLHMQLMYMRKLKSRIVTDRQSSCKVRWKRQRKPSFSGLLTEQILKDSQNEYYR